MKLEPLTAKGLSGQVQELSLVDILQMYHHGRQSVAVIVSGPIAGWIRLRDGELVHAEAGRLRGLAALARLLAATTGTVSTEVSPRDAQQTIDGRFQWVVLQALHRLDEQNRSTDSSVDRTELSVDPVVREPRATRSAFPKVAGAAGLDSLPANTPPARRDLASQGLTLIADSIDPTTAGATEDPDAAALFSRRLLGRRGAPALVVWLSVLLIVGVGVVLFFVAGGGTSSQDPTALSPSMMVTTGALSPGSTVPPGSTVSQTAAAGTELDHAPDVVNKVTTFSLTIDSTPRGATVTEHGKVLGTTPLTMAVERASVATRPRKLVLHRPGYSPYTLEQGDSETAVRASAVLAASRRAGDGARHAETAARSDGPPPPYVSEAPSAKRSDSANLEIRLRR